MIVRIMGDQQYRVGSAMLDHLNALDNDIVKAIERGDEARFHQQLAEMIREVRSEGKPLESSEIHVSDIIIPPEDLTIKEAQGIFTGEGIIPE